MKIILIFITSALPINLFILQIHILRSLDCTDIFINARTRIPEYIVILQIQTSSTERWFGVSIISRNRVIETNVIFNV